MLEHKENIGYRITKAGLAVLFILFVLSYFNRNESNPVNRIKDNISKEVMLSLENAVVSSDFQVIPAHNQKFSKIRFPEEKLINNLIIENRINNFFILLQRKITSEKAVNTVFAFYRHIFPREKDEVPLAG
jgi:hypothetical protein